MRDEKKKRLKELNGEAKVEEKSEDDEDNDEDEEK